MKNSSIMMLVFLFFTVASTGLKSQEKLKVLASASIFQDMAAHIGGEKITATSIVPIGGDPHLYEPVPSDVAKVQGADIILINGLTFEGWISQLVENSGTQATSVLITEGVNPLGSSVYENATDPHAWMDASNGLIYARNIYNAIIEVDPDNSSYYKERYDTYVTQLKELDTYISTQIKTIPEFKRVLITSHDAFAYYGHRYGIELSAIMGISTEAEAQTSDVMRVISDIKERGVPAVFIESTINPKLVKQIASDTGAKIGGELYADSIGEEGSPGHGYIEMLRHNTDVIVQALTLESIDTDSSKSDTETNYLIYVGIGLFLLLAFLFLVYFIQRK